jgi:hypothetical protein
MPILPPADFEGDAATSFRRRLRAKLLERGWAASEGPALDAMVEDLMRKETGMRLDVAAILREEEPEPAAAAVRPGL